MKDQIINKPDLIERIADRTGLNRTSLNIMIDQVILEIAVRVRDGQTVQFRGFGKFEIRFRKIRSAATSSGGSLVTASKTHHA